MTILIEEKGSILTKTALNLNFLMLTNIILDWINNKKIKKYYHYLSSGAMSQDETWSAPALTVIFPN